MSASLIPVVAGRIGLHDCLTVDGRTLHAFLEVGKVFAAWINDRIQQYSFAEGEDFEVFSDSGKNPAGGRPSKDYRLTLNMAKELAMVERTPRGQQARHYFIACEAELLAIRSQPAVPAHTAFAFDAKTQWDLLDALKLDAIRRVSRAAAEAYLLDCGITPAFIADRFAQHGMPVVRPEALPGAVAAVLPFDRLCALLEQHADQQDGSCWYCLPATLARLCDGYDMRATVAALNAQHALRRGPGAHMTIKAPGRLFGHRRPRVFGIFKPSEGRQHA